MLRVSLLRRVCFFFFPSSHFSFFIPLPTFVVHTGDLTEKGKCRASAAEQHQTRTKGWVRGFGHTHLCVIPGQERLVRSGSLCSPVRIEAYQSYRSTLGTCSTGRAWLSISRALDLECCGVFFLLFAPTPPPPPTHDFDIYTRYTTLFPYAPSALLYRIPTATTNSDWSLAPISGSAFRG